jgi:hypothetical protein
MVRHSGLLSSHDAGDGAVKQVAVQGNRVVIREGKVGTAKECCCETCACNDCPVKLGYTVTFYGTRDGTLTFTHPYARPSGGLSLALCERRDESTSYLLALQHDEQLPFGFLNIATFQASFACGPSVDNTGRSWYVSLGGYILLKNPNGPIAEGDAVSIQCDGIIDFCDNNGLPVLDTDTLPLVLCSDYATGQPLVPCQGRIKVDITTK